jgi:hypothetical protein
MERIQQVASHARQEMKTVYGVIQMNLLYAQHAMKIISLQILTIRALPQLHAV